VGEKKGAKREGKKPNLVLTNPRTWKKESYRLAHARGRKSKVFNKNQAHGLDKGHSLGAAKGLGRTSLRKSSKGKKRVLYDLDW